MASKLTMLKASIESIPNRQKSSDAFEMRENNHKLLRTYLTVSCKKLMRLTFYSLSVNGDCNDYDQN